MVHTAYISTLVICFAIPAQAQFVVNDQLSAGYLVQEIFQGPGVIISNVTINGLADSTMNPSMGSYEYTGNLGIPQSGIILSTGIVSVAWSGDGSDYDNEPDLMVLSGWNIYDAMVLEFDFIPEEETVIFEYVFASAEYTNYTCSPYNDLFGAFLYGPGLTGPYQNDATNIALLPYTQAYVSINTVNSGQSSIGNDQYCEAADPNWQSNSIYFIADVAAELLGFNGMTVVLQANSVVVPGEVYHLKLAIGDASNAGHDSGIFLQAASFRSVASLATSLAREQAARNMHAWFNGEGMLQVDGGERTIEWLRVYDPQGKLLEQVRVSNSGLITIPATNFKPGLYLLEAGAGTRTLRSKVVMH